MISKLSNFSEEDYIRTIETWDSITLEQKNYGERYKTICYSRE